MIVLLYKIAAQRRKTPKISKKYTEAAVTECLQAIKSGVSTRKACRRYNVPRSTVMFRASSKWSGKPRRGKPTALTAAEEDSIVRWITRMARKGFPITKERVQSTVDPDPELLVRPELVSSAASTVEKMYYLDQAQIRKLLWSK